MSSPDTTALVRCDGAARTFGTGTAATVALQPTDCAVAPADRIALTGSSGSGKSTLLHLMAGLDEPTVGTVTWPALGGRPDLRPGPVAVVFQGPSLLPPLTVEENVALPLVLAGVADRPAHDAARVALGRLGLVELAERLPEELSGGQAQRVAVSRALAGCAPAHPRGRAHGPARPGQRRGGRRCAAGGGGPRRLGTRRLDARPRGRGAALGSLGSARRASHNQPPQGGRMVTLTWLQRAARTPPAASGLDRARRRRRRGAAGLDRHVPVVDDLADDRPRDRPGPGRLAGRGADPGRRRRRVLGATRHHAGVEHALPVSFARAGGLSATAAGTTQTDRSGPGARLARRLRPHVPRGHPRSGRLGQRRAALPADGGQSPRPTRRRHHRRHRPDGSEGEGRRHRRPAEHRLAVPAGRRPGRCTASGSPGQRRAPSAARVRPDRVASPGGHAGACGYFDTGCQAARTPRTRRSRGAPGTSRRSSPAAAWSATTSGPRSTPRARTRCTRSCCSSSSASPARSSPGSSRSRSRPPGGTAAAVTPRSCGREGHPRANSCVWPWRRRR